MTDTGCEIHSTAVLGDHPDHRAYRDGVATFPPIFGPDVRVSAFVAVDAGLVGPTRIGARCFLMTHSYVGHDAWIGPDCELGPGTRVGGYAVLGEGVRCGIGAQIKPYVRIGAGARIGMGAVVLRDVPAGEVWVGNPARKLR